LIQVFKPAPIHIRYHPGVEEIQTETKWYIIVPVDDIVCCIGLVIRILLAPSANKISPDLCPVNRPFGVFKDEVGSSAGDYSIAYRNS
jgi:hypothetical protein